MTTTEIIPQSPKVSVVVPARNEEASLGACLESLVAQQGVDFEILVVDDHSTDRTREIAASFANARMANVRVIEAGPLPGGWTGKNNAVSTGAREAKGEWLLFTDADTLHLPGSLASALKEAQDNGAELLSYSPEQIAITFWEMATLPVVFAELAREYPPSKVSDPNSSAAAANGQYVLITRAAYDGVGGHAAVAHDILEDVALARAVKRMGRKIRFRYAADAVRTRMYRNFRQLREGWTKNLALLFPNQAWLAAKSLFWWALPWAILSWPFVMQPGAELNSQFASSATAHREFFTAEGIVRHWWWISSLALSFLYLINRIRRAHFTTDMNLLAAFFGMPMFAYLLLRSKRAHANHAVPWKGRTYTGEDLDIMKTANPTPTTAGRLS